MTETGFRSLPSIDALVAEVVERAPEVAHGPAVEAARAVVAEARAAVAAGGSAPTLDVLAMRAVERAAAMARPSLVRVINASGVVLHTNLGRAPLSERAIAAMASVAGGYSNLEYDLEKGGRGSRHDHARELIRRVTGAEDAIVVNNNAAALFMALQALAQGREVIVSRGQAVEIGGGFRIPDVIRQSGASIVEVGTTNRTYGRDYARAVTEQTRAILRVHASNFRVVGFTASPSIEELSSLANERGVLLFDDLGSGALIDTAVFGMAHEPTVQESLAAGADLVLFSGDKLLGGPQCGIIAGRGGLIAELRGHPLARALRVDKLTLAALNATLVAYASGSEREEIPIWRMVGAPLDKIEARAARWAAVAGTGGVVVAGTSMIGGGSLPGEGVATRVAALADSGGAERLAERLRQNEPPVIGRIDAERVLLDPRTVDPSDDERVARAVELAMS